MTLPIGFFSPLPLAIMIPFMATQSILMMYGAGSAWQFGKRKISAKTNEEIDAMTLNDLMKEQTVNVSAMIPDLHEQMELSYRLQIDIFQEMVKIIPAFFEALMKAWNASPVAEEFRNFNTTPFNQDIPRGDSVLVSASGQSAPTLISHSELTPPIPTIEPSKYSQAIFRSMSLDELIRGINSGRFTGSDLSLARHVLNDRQSPVDTGATTATPIQIQHQEWKRNLVSLQKAFVSANNILQTELQKASAGQPRYRGNVQTSWIASKKKIVSDLASKIRTISNDYRNPNESIRRDVLILRQQIANGLLG